MRRYLAVDDSDVALLFLAESLTRLGGQCDVARDGEEAVARFLAALDQNRPYDAVFLDIMMPRMDGLEAARRIKDIQDERCPQPRAKVLIISCLHDPVPMVESHFECGADIYLPKPLDEDVLAEALINLELLEAPVNLDID